MNPDHLKKYIIIPVLKCLDEVKKGMYSPAAVNLLLGTAAVEDAGDGNGLEADLLDGLHAAAFLLVGGTAVDSDLLGGLAAAVFARKDVATEQVFNGIVNSSLTSVSLMVAVTNPSRVIGSILIAVILSIGVSPA